MYDFSNSEKKLFLFWYSLFFTPGTPPPSQPLLQLYSQVTLVTKSGISAPENQGKSLSSYLCIIVYTWSSSLGKGLKSCMKYVRTVVICKRTSILQMVRPMVGVIRTKATFFGRAKFWTICPQAPFSPIILVRTKVKSQKVSTKQGGVKALFFQNKVSLNGYYPHLVSAVAFY